MLITDLLDELQIPYAEGGSHHHVREGWVGVECPWCQTGDKWHLGIPTENPYICVCWLCGRHSLNEYLHLALGLPWSEARQRVESLTVDLRPAGTHVVEKRDVRVPKHLEPLTGPYSDYLRRRGFDPRKLAATWGLQATGPIGLLSWRIWIPIYDSSGQLVSWTTRAIHDKVKNRYISAGPDDGGLPVKTLLYGEHLVSGQAVIVVEGPTDVWRIGPGAVAVLGVNWTMAQVKRLERFSRRVILFDRSFTAIDAACRLYEQLSAVFGDTQVLECTSPDPGTLSPKDVEDLRKGVFGPE